MHRSTIAIVSLLAVSAAAAQQLASIEGTVINALTKEPVRKAEVTLEMSKEALVATTDAAGHFRFANVEAGRHKLTVEKTGFAPGAYRALDADDDEGSLLRVAVGDRFQDIMLRLFPEGAITGRVVDSDGDPMSGTQVLLLSRLNDMIIHHTSTNSAGEYRFDNVPPGAYLISADVSGWRYPVRHIPVDSQGKVTNLRQTTTFYPSALSRSEAQSIKVEGGAEKSGIDIRVQRVPTMTVTGKIEGLSGAVSKYSLVTDTSESATIQPNGDFVLTGLPPGDHRLKLMEPGSNELCVVGRAEVTLTDQDVTGIEITPFPPAKVRVRVVLESEPDKPLTRGSVALISLEKPDNNSRFGNHEPRDGAYFFDGVTPGKYLVDFNNTDGYLKSVQSGGQPLDSLSIDVSEGADLDLLVTYCRNVASLGGDVAVSQDQSGSPVSVMLLLEGPELPYQMNYRWPQLDQSFHFADHHLRPGKYLAFAMQDSDADLWYDAQFIEAVKSEAAEVELHEKDHSTVHLKLISKDETDNLRKRLGIP